MNTRICNPSTVQGSPHRQSHRVLMSSKRNSLVEQTSVKACYYGVVYPLTKGMSTCDKIVANPVYVFICVARSQPAFHRYIHINRCITAASSGFPKLSFHPFLICGTYQVHSIRNDQQRGKLPPFLSLNKLFNKVFLFKLCVCAALL